MWTDKITALILTLILTASWQLQAQTTLPDSTGSTTLIVENADNVLGEKQEDIYVKFLTGNIRIRHDSSYFFCDQAIIRDQELEATGNVVILQPADTTTLFSDTLIYHADSLKAWLNGRVLLRYQDKELKTKALEYNLDTRTARYSTNGQLRQDSTLLKSRTGVYQIRKDLVQFRDYVTIRDSSFTLIADSLKYNTRRKKALFTGPTYIRQDSANIYCESGYFDMKRNEAEFGQNPIFQENDKTAKAIKMRYIEAQEVFILAGSAKYRDDEQDVRADTIRYYREEEKSLLTGHVTVTTDKEQITGSHIVYYHETGDFESRGRTTLQDEDIRLTAEFIDFREEDGAGIAKGDVILQDTVSKSTIFCDELITTDQHKKFKAFNLSDRRPRMERIQDQDTLFLSADTLYSMERISGLDTFQLIYAYPDVRIFQNDFQAVSDSLSYDSGDSLFVLFRHPVAWSDSTQFSGDTISIFLRKEKIQRLFVRQNAMILSEQGGDLFNQIAGRSIEAFFADDTLRSMQTRGNAQTLYYLKDEAGAFTGAVKTVCSHMAFRFKGEELDAIRYYEEPVSVMSPIRQELSRPQRLDGFNWQIERKPPDKNVDIRLPRIRVAEDALPPAEPEMNGPESGTPESESINSEKSAHERALPEAGEILEEKAKNESEVPETGDVLPEKTAKDGENPKTGDNQTEKLPETPKNDEE